MGAASTSVGLSALAVALVVVVVVVVGPAVAGFAVAAVAVNLRPAMTMFSPSVIFSSASDLASSRTRPLWHRRTVLTSYSSEIFCLMEEIVSVGSTSNSLVAPVTVRRTSFMRGRERERKVCFLKKRNRETLLKKCFENIFFFFQKIQKNRVYLILNFQQNNLRKNKNTHFEFSHDTKSFVHEIFVSLPLKFILFLLLFCIQQSCQSRSF